MRVLRSKLANREVSFKRSAAATRWQVARSEPSQELLQQLLGADQNWTPQSVGSSFRCFQVTLGAWKRVLVIAPKRACDS